MTIDAFGILASIIGVLGRLIGRKPGIEARENSGQINVITGHHGSQKITNVSFKDGPTRSIATMSSLELIGLARQRLYEPGGLVEGINLARYIAEKRGDDQTRRWLDWEINGYPRNLNNDYSARSLALDLAPYRIKATDVPTTSPSGDGTEGKLRVNLFLSIPIERIERHLERFRVSNEAMSLLSMNDDVVLAVDLQGNRTVSFGDWKASVSEAHLEEIRNKLRAAVEVWLMSQKVSRGRPDDS